MGDEIPPLPARGNICSRCISARYMLTILGSVGMAIVYGLKVNLSVVIVAMLNHTAISTEHQPDSTIDKHDVCDPKDHRNVSMPVEDGPFTWPGTMQGTMLSSYFWGYILAQLPGARMAELYSAKWTMFFAVAINIVCTILTPLAAKIHFGAMLLLRVLGGIGGGVTFPAMHVLLANWAPPAERSMMTGNVYAGTTMGTCISMTAAGIITIKLGWENVFYIMGGVCGIWLVLWALLVADTPLQQTYIDEEERSFLVARLGVGTKKQPVPWRAIFTSPSFLAILVAHTCNNWGWYVILIELPLYMKSIQNLPMKYNALLISMPFMSMCMYGVLFSQLFDSLRHRKIINTTCARKTATFIAGFVPMICFIAMMYTGCLYHVVLMLVTVSVTVNGGIFTGFLANHIDISPNFAGTLMAITNTAATIPGIIVPLYTGHLIQNDPSQDAWRIIFGTTAAFYLIEVLVYVMFASGEEQPWNRIEENDYIEAQPLNLPSVEPPGDYKSTCDDDDENQAGASTNGTGK